MKKFWLSLGLTFVLACWSGGGYYGFGTCAAFGQGYYSPSLSCNASDPDCYNDYYAAPYADPLSQLLYYVAPPVERDYRYEAPQRYEHQEGYREGRGRGHEGREHEGRGHEDRGQR